MSRSKSPRPLSGGAWSVLAWLRREDRGSTDTLSSEGSARTAASFAFLHPAGYPCAAPVELQPPPSPTDSYKKRVRDGDCRRQYERDLTIHRKYLLPLGESRYTSLPPTRRSGEERERRATSESLRRAAHVPGKRRAPPPPITSTLRRRTGKGPAPRPPILLDVEEPNKNKMFKQENTDLKKEEHKTNQFKHESYTYNINTERLVPSNKTITKETKTEQSEDVCEVVQCNKKETKIRQDKSFLKQIFEIRSKRNSAIDIPPVKLLPSISELDKQAAELLKSYKLKAFEQNNNVSSKNDENKNISEEKRFCTRCLKKYDSTMVTCLDCLSEAKTSTDSNKYRDTCLALKHSETQTSESVINSGTSKNSEDKQKLKEMLKEMKDSLSKKAKPDKSDIKKSYYFNNTQASDENIVFAKETPTLPSGSSLQNKHNQKLTVDSVEIKEKIHSPENILNFSTVVTTSTTVINQSPQSVQVLKNEIKKPPISNTDENVENETHIQPVKLSTLLNPVYIPKNSGNKTSNIAAKESFLLGSPNQSPWDINKSKNLQKSQLKFEQHVAPSCSRPSIDSTTSEKMLTKQNEVAQNKIHGPSHKKEIMHSKKLTSTIEVNKNTKDLVSNSFTSTQDCAIASTSTVVPDVINNVRLCTDQHSKRRDLINQLERSIATGDEQAAADAAIKLAQLRLSCSVLSFSSQIIANSSIVTPTETVCNTNKVKTDTTKSQERTTSCKVDSGTQSEGTKCIKILVNKPEIRTEVLEIDNKKHTTMLDNNSTKVQKENDVVTETKALVKNKPGSSVSENVPLVSTTVEVKDKNTTVEVWIEDREAARGPVRLEVSPEGSLGALRGAAEETLGLPQRLQRWIIGRTLCTQDDTPLVSLAGPALDAPFYLCLVESEATKETEAVTSTSPTEAGRPGSVYTELLELERQALVSNTRSFECTVCLERCGEGAGVVLRECLHEFCRTCLAAAVRHAVPSGEAGAARVPCPARECPASLLEREARALSPADHERRLARALAATAAAQGTRSVRCRTRDCAGWALRDDGAIVATFRCPLCDALNCLSCQAIHEGETCGEHRARLARAAEGAGEGGSQTDQLVVAMKERGEALECPSCGALLTKQWGCDWVRCAACRTEICWVTRGPRWGPAGRGDITAGCRCGVDGKRCHPTCGYCH